MSRLNMDDSLLNDPKIVKGLKLGTLTQVLAAGLTIDEDMAPIINVDPDGSTRILTFPAPSAQNEGMVWLVNNWAGGAEDLTINNSAAATIGTISQNEAGLVFIAGGVTYCRLVGTTT
jgi:hypothetical protein